MRALSIAFFSKELPSDRPNGVACQVDRLANALCGRGHRVTCFSFSPPPQHARYHTVVLPYQTGSRLLRKFIPAFAFRSVAKDGFDICHYHGDDYLCRGSRRRVRTFYGSALFEALHARTLRRHLYQGLFYFFEWISCLRRGALVSISPRRSAGLPLVRHVIPCGVPLSRYSPGIKKSRAPSLLFLGDLDSRKQGRRMVAAFTDRVRPEVTDATLTIVGPQEVTGAGLHWRCGLTEDELIEEYRHAWIFCTASSYEGFGVPVIEAMACGTPVVAVDSPGARRLITHGRTGLICRSHELGEVLTSLLQDPARRESLSAAGRRDVTRFAMERIAGRYEELYAACAGEER